MTKYNLKKKFNYNDKELRKFFVENGYVIIKNIIDKKTVEDLLNYVKKSIKTLENLSKKKKIKEDFESWSIAIISKLEKKSFYKRYIKSVKLISLLKEFLGPDICTLGYNSLWINNPTNKNPVLNKKPHVDAWTGTSINTLFFKMFLTNVDKYNGLTVYPGSHLQGMIPVKSRIINEEDFKIRFNKINLDNLKTGDCVMWHALTLHATTGQSNKNVRLSITARFTSTESFFSSQEKALGFETLTVGPLNQILRIIGNDYLFPLRTYNTFTGTDKRLAELYDSKKTNHIESISGYLD